MARLYSRTVRQEQLSAPTRARMLALMQLCYEDVDRTRFFADLAAKQFVILLFGRADDQLLGFSTLRLGLLPRGGRTAEVLFSGDTVIHPDWWGEKVLDVAFSRFLLRRRLAHPFRPLYWLLLSAGYKTYLIIINYFVGALPRRGRTAEGRDLAFRDAVATAWWGPRYDPRTGVMRFAETYRVRAGIAPLDRITAAHPDIAYYLAANPGHASGDELVCLAQVRWRDFARIFVRIVWKRGRRLGRGVGRYLPRWLPGRRRA